MFVGAIVVFIAPASIGSPLIKGLITILGYIMIVASVSFMGNANFGIMASMAGPSLTDRNRMSVMGARMMAMATIVTSLTILPIKTAIYNATGNEQLGYLMEKHASAKRAYGTTTRQIIGPVPQPQSSRSV